MTQLYGIMLQRRHHIGEASAIGAARRDAQRLAAELGLDETSSGRLGIVVTELATNVLRHAGAGELLIQAIPGAAGSAVEVLAIDRGQGMGDLQTCLRDGYSSAGTSGNGLGAVKRLAAEFDVESLPGKGTVVMARVGSRATLRIGAVCVARDGESECGDTWRMARDAKGRCALMVADGLGHGPSAAAAAGLAAATFISSPFDPPQQQIERVHHALINTRGAAVACAVWTDARGVSYAGVGNIAGRLSAADGSRGLVSHGGTLGFQVRRVQQFEYPAGDGALLIMHSDGLTARWELNDHGNLRRCHPALVAAALYRDHLRGKDDATIVVAPV